MIRNFSEYIKEELKDETYASASSKLKKLGGVHKKRALEIENWMIKSKSLGEVNVNLNIIKPLKYDSELAPMEYNINIDKEKILKEGPLKCDISYIGLENDQDLLIPDDRLIEDLRYINIMVNVYNDISLSSFNIFAFFFELEWLSKDQFRISPLKITPAFNYYDRITLFSDRKSALVFKNAFSKYMETNEEIKNFFMSFSSREEYDKLISMCKSFPTNSLYN